MYTNKINLTFSVLYRSSSTTNISPLLYSVLLTFSNHFLRDRITICLFFNCVHMVGSKCLDFNQWGLCVVSTGLGSRNSASCSQLCLRPCLSCPGEHPSFWTSVLYLWDQRLCYLYQGLINYCSWAQSVPWPIFV